MNIKCMTYDDM